MHSLAREPWRPADPADLAALDWRLDPFEAILAWPTEEAMALLAADEARWTLLMPASSARRLARRAATTRDPEEAIDELAELLGRRPLASSPRLDAERGDRPPFSLGAAVLLSYELGARLEPSASRRCGDSSEVPDAWVVRPPWMLLHDRDRDRWWRLAAAPREVPAWVDDLPRRPRVGAAYRLAPLRADRAGAAFTDAVARTVELIHAGDLFQANVAQRFSTSLDGRPRAVAAAALRGHAARHGAYLELDDSTCVLSMSPECFLEGRGDRVVTRPIKGTRPSGVDPSELLASAKDAAELAMIVDLMRNDLGRVCRLGSVEVVEARRLERHPTVLHAVAEVGGRLREDVDAARLLAATFPPGSVTGAPKIRAMQVIEEVEPVARGAYCGSIGWIDDRHGVRLNVAIRTALLCREGDERWLVRYHAGCGIVADSEPAAEAAESLAKTAVLRRLERSTA